MIPARRPPRRAPLRTSVDLDRLHRVELFYSQALLEAELLAKSAHGEAQIDLGTFYDHARQLKEELVALAERVRT